VSIAGSGWCGADAEFRVVPPAGEGVSTLVDMKRLTGSQYPILSPGLARSGNDVQEDGEEVADAPGEDKDVPDRVMERQASKRRTSPPRANP
jgi:hypothetical protein